MKKRVTPNSSQIGIALKSGGLAAVDELFYPGEKRRHQERLASFPKPEGTGRLRWQPETRYVTEFELPEWETGVRVRTSVWKGDCRIGYFDTIRRGFCDTYYRSHDGEEFAHWRGPTGVTGYMIDRFWLYGDPEPNTLPFYPLSDIPRWICDQLTKLRKEFSRRRAS